MPDRPSNYYYHPIPGSRGLLTKADGAVAELARIERARGDETVELDFGGLKLFKTAPPEKGVEPQIILKAVDGLDPMPQAVFLFLFLTAFSNGANWVRVGMNELAKSARISRRRLLRTLSELTASGKIKPIDRDRNGTLYYLNSVHLVNTVHSQPDKSGAITATAKVGKTRAAPMRDLTKPIESPINEESFPHGKQIVTIKEIAGMFFSETGVKPDELKMDEAISQITYLLEDGFTRDEIIIGVRYLARMEGKSAGVGKLPYIMADAIREKPEQENN